MLKIWRNILLFTALIQIAGCKEPYDPSVNLASDSYLVVEGFINANGISTFKLSRTLKLADKGAVKNEINARVNIEGDNNTRFALAGSGDGTYSSAALSLPVGQNYRLRINTSNGKEYLSNYTEVKPTPDMDLSWTQSADGLTISVSSQDDKNSTLYYQWNYEETWAIRSVAPSEFVTDPTLENVGVNPRAPEEVRKLLFCWGSSNSSNIITASTAMLARDAIVDKPLVFIPSGAEKLSIRYSVLVKQNAISREAFEFFELMKKNSEQMGTMFDPQPSLVRGNIRCTTDPEEPVIGFIVAASGVEKRIFIAKEELNDWNFSMNCVGLYILNVRDSLNKYLRTDTYLLTRGEPSPNASSERMLGYYALSSVCVDCRSRGSSDKPLFW